MIKYPAICVINWPSGPVNCCDRHMKELIAVATHLGIRVVATQLNIEAECSNCVNENKERR